MMSQHSGYSERDKHIYASFIVPALGKQCLHVEKMKILYINEQSLTLFS
jgi:hypothetical protein